MHGFILGTDPNLTVPLEPGKTLAPVAAYGLDGGAGFIREIVLRSEVVKDVVGV